MAAAVGVSYPVLTDRAQRAKLALGAVAWAYLNEVAQGNFVNATGLLTLFQQLFNEHRDSVLVVSTPPWGPTYGFDPADRAAADAMIPRSVAVNGMFDASTRTALVATLIGVAISPGDADSMPTMAGQLGRWFALDVAELMSRTAEPGSVANFLWAVADVASTASLANAAMDVHGAVVPYIEGGASAVNAPLATQVANAQARNVVRQSGGSEAVRAIERGAGVDQPSGGAPSIFELPSMVVTAPRSKKGPDWGVWVAIAGGAALAGVLGYQVWRVSKGKRRRR